MVVFLIVLAGVLAVLWGVTIILIVTGKLSGSDWIKNSLGLPDGSVRALLALLILAFIFWAATQKVELGDLPQWAIGILGTVIGFYFGAQTVSSAQNGVRQNLAITTVSLPGGSAGVPYSAALAATGGMPPYSWAIVSQSPGNWLSINPLSGALGGTPPTANRYNFTAQVSDSLGKSAAKSFPVTVV